jgi:hypothetical protein
MLTHESSFASIADSFLTMPSWLRVSRCCCLLIAAEEDLFRRCLLVWNKLLARWMLLDLLLLYAVLDLLGTDLLIAGKCGFPSQAK